MEKNQLFDFVISLADNALILGQRLAQNCGHGPILEQDIAITNISLDHFGQARSLFQYAAEVQGAGKSEDDLAFFRDVYDFKNVLLVELPENNFGETICRLFFYSAYLKPFYTALTKSKDQQLAAIAEKSLKEVIYHLRYSSEWMIRLGDGTAESHEIMQEAVNDLWMWTGELFEMSSSENDLLKEGVSVDLNSIQPLWMKTVSSIFERATLEKPKSEWFQSGGKKGHHTEHMGFILAEMQHLPRTYPDAKW